VTNTDGRLVVMALTARRATGCPCTDASSLQSELTASPHPIFLLGERYVLADEDGPNDAEIELLVSDWHSIAYFCYRRGFSELPGGKHLTTDEGWGCTLRSGQMLLARALQMMLLGRGWRYTPTPTPSPAGAATPLLSSADAAAGQDVYTSESTAGDTRARLLRLFDDVEGAPFGLHGLLRDSVDASPGCWLGPHALCGALAAAVRRELGDAVLRVRVLGAGGGGAPALYVEDVADAAQSGVTTACTPPTRLPPTARATSDVQPRWTPVLLLLPLRLGPERTLDAAYIPQLRAALACTACCGIVGGRPSSSLFFVGSGGAGGGELLFLDPHEVRLAGDVAPLQRPHNGDSIRTMAAAAADPCVALGFIVCSRAELDGLAAALRQAAEAAPAAPLLTVCSRSAEAAADRDEESAESEEDAEWAFVV